MVVAADTSPLLSDTNALDAVMFSILLNSSAAEAFTSAFTITPLPIAAVPLEMVMSPLIPPSMYVATLDIAVFLFVPPAPSSTISKSASTRLAPISVPPSISKALRATLPAVLIVASLVSAMAALDLISAFTIFVIVLLSESIDLFVSVAVEAVDTRSTSPPVLGNVSVLDALAECGAACSACA